MTQWQSLWRQQCSVWIDSINRNRREGSVHYDYDQHRLTLVPRSCFVCGSDDWGYTTMDEQMEPIMDAMTRHRIEHEIKMDASYRNRPSITIDRIHIYLDGAEAITQLALIVEPEWLMLRGSLKDSV